MSLRAKAPKTDLQAAEHERSYSSSGKGRITSQIRKQRGWNLTAESEKRRIVVYMVVGPLRFPNEFEPQHRSHEQRCAHCCKKAAYRSQGAKCSRRSMRGAKRTTRGWEKEDEENPHHRQQRDSAVQRQHYQDSQQPPSIRIPQNRNQSFR
jgi:hypothetical protein